MSDSTVLNSPAPTHPSPEPRLGFNVTPGTVSEAADRADQMIRDMAALAAQGATPADPATPPAALPQGEGVVGSETTPVVSAEAGGEGVQPPPVVPAPPPADAAMSVLQAQIDALHQELRTWRGRYDAEVPRERQQRMDAEAKLVDMQRQLEEAKAAAIPPPPEYKALTAEEIEQYGEEMFAMVERFLMPKIGERIAAAIAGLSPRFATLEGNLTQASAKLHKTEADLFYERLDALMPTWREIDASEAFNMWLEEPDDFFGEPRKNALAKRAQTRDDRGVIRVFEAFVNQRAASGSPVPAGNTPAQAPGTGEAPTAPTVPAPAPALADFAAPGRPNAAPTPANNGAPGGKRSWSMADIRRFYTDQQRGVYSGRAAEADQIERDIAAAQREGRVTQ